MRIDLLVLYEEERTAPRDCGACAVEKARRLSDEIDELQDAIMRALARSLADWVVKG
ncbi:MAG: hypothetical protein ACHQRJ_24620 [Alphaproteobacteria bacterium]